MQMLQCMALTWALLACASTAARADDQIARGDIWFISWVAMTVTPLGHFSVSQTRNIRSPAEMSVCRCQVSVCAGLPI